MVVLWLLCWAALLIRLVMVLPRRIFSRNHVPAKRSRPCRTMIVIGSGLKPMSNCGAFKRIFVVRFLILLMRRTINGKEHPNKLMLHCMLFWSLLPLTSRVSFLTLCIVVQAGTRQRCCACLPRWI